MLTLIPLLYSGVHPQALPQKLDGIGGTVEDASLFGAAQMSFISPLTIIYLLHC